MATTQTKKKVISKKKTPKAQSAAESFGALVCAAGEQCFWSCDGQILATLVDLQTSLRGMSAESYAHHVTKNKNDFADWVEFVLIDKACADGLRKAKTHKAALLCIEKRLGLAA